jgi:hypothetical protein
MAASGRAPDLLRHHLCLKTNCSGQPRPGTICLSTTGRAAPVALGRLAGAPRRVSAPRTAKSEQARRGHDEESGEVLPLAGCDEPLEMPNVRRSHHDLEALLLNLSGLCRKDDIAIQCLVAGGGTTAPAGLRPEVCSP